MRRLGEVECRDCGYVREPSAPASAVSVPVCGAVPGGVAAAAGPEGGGAGGPVSGVGAAGARAPDFGETPGLAEEVELALARVLGRAGRARIG